MENKEIYNLIGYYFSLPKGHTISHPTMKIEIVPGIRVSRQVLKHITEARMEDQYDLSKIQDIFAKIPDTIRKPDFVIPNWNKTYPRSLVSVRLYFEMNQALIVVHDSRGNIIDIINGFFREKRKYDKLKAKSQ
jgi:hypothetical protein